MDNDVRKVYLNDTDFNDEDRIIIKKLRAALVEKLRKACFAGNMSFFL